jgi:DNA-binding response OmpR family regulator
MRVLVIDDDAQMRVLLRQVFEWSGYTVLEAENGRKGMEAQRENQVELVVTDLIMPEQEGFETISLMRKEFPKTKIVAISGGGRIEPDAYLPSALELGADLVFSKPFVIKELMEKIRELMEDDL